MISFVLRHGERARWLVRQNERHPRVMGYLWAALSPTMPSDLARDASLHTFRSLQDSVRSLILDIDWEILTAGLKDVVVLRGQDDELGDPVYIDQLTRRCGARFEQVRGAGHHLPLTHRELVSDWLR